MLNFQDLPDELVLKLLSYSETKDLISCGQVSKRIRRISLDHTLWVTVNLVNKIVKTELLEMLLNKGCKSLNISNSTIVGSFSLKSKYKLKALDLSQSAWARKWPDKQAYCKESCNVIEELLSSCCSLHHLNMEGLLLTPKMAASICNNGKTLQGLNLNCRSDLLYDPIIGNTDYTVPNGNYQAIIKCCQELKEVDLAFVNDSPELSEDDIKFLAKSISPNIVKLNLCHQDVLDDHVKILLSRCNKIKVLNLAETFITQNLLKTIRQYLNHTLEELSMSCYGYTSFLELKKMPRLKILNLYANKEDAKKIHNLRQLIPHVIVRTFFCDFSGEILPDLNLLCEDLD